MEPRLEVACFNPESAVLAAAAGADRIELCTDRQAGGYTPPADWLPRIKAAVEVPIHVMIRPRPGDFYYSDREFAAMQAALLKARHHGADGFVFGLLLPGGGIDEVRCKALIDLAAPLPCTFHRAFDLLEPAFAAAAGLERLIGLGFSTVLSSGFAASAYEGRIQLRNLVRQAGRRIAIMPGGGIRSETVGSLRTMVGAAWYHSAATSAAAGDRLDPAEVAALKTALKSTIRNRE